MLNQHSGCTNCWGPTVLISAEFFHCLDFTSDFSSEVLNVGTNCLLSRQFSDVFSVNTLTLDWKKTAEKTLWMSRYTPLPLTDIAGTPLDRPCKVVLGTVDSVERSVCASFLTRSFVENDRDDIEI